MKNEISIKARIIRWGFKRWSNRLGKSLKNLNETAHKQRYVKTPRFMFYRYDKSQLFINDDLYYVIKPKQITNNTNAFMYIHGGAFVSQITRPHWRLIKRLVKITRACAYVPIYSLSNPWYSSCEDDISFLINLYKKMLDTYQSENITIIGDSAGGSFSIILGQQLKLQNIPKPKNIIAMSPGLDLSDTIHNNEREVKLNKNDVLNEDMLVFAQKWFIKSGDDPRKPIYSPIYGNSSDIGFLTIFVGEQESFVDQCRRFHDKLNNESIPHNYIERKGMFHVYPIFRLKESKQDMELITNLIIK